MSDYLAIKLEGVMQAWGGHTYEDLRQTELIPTRSALLGLLAACLGIERNDVPALESLSASLAFAIRLDSAPQRLLDFHTVLEARKVDGSVNKNPIVSRREYLCDAKYTVLIQLKLESSHSLEQLTSALQQPVYTPFLGRRACPLSRPLFEVRLMAIDIQQAFSLLEPVGGVIYSEQRLHSGDAIWRLRGEPIYARKRQFATHSLYIHAQKEASYASE